MFNSWIFWGGIACLASLVTVGALRKIRRLRADRWLQDEQRQEEERQRQEEQRQKEAEEAERKERRRKNLVKQHFVVYIREKDGKKTVVEASLIGALRRYGFTVEFITEKDGRAISNGDTSLLKDGLLALIGTGWYNGCYCCDWRVLTASGDARAHIVSGDCNYGQTSPESLAGNIVERLLATMPELPEKSSIPVEHSEICATAH